MQISNNFLGVLRLLKFRYLWKLFISCEIEIDKNLSYAILNRSNTIYDRLRSKEKIYLNNPIKLD